MDRPLSQTQQQQMDTPSHHLEGSSRKEEMRAATGIMVRQMIQYGHGQREPAEFGRNRTENYLWQSWEVLAFTSKFAITPDNLIVACTQHKTKHLLEGIRKIELRSLYPLRFIDLSVFRRRSTQWIKVAFNNIVRYFELGRIDKRVVFWKLWCLHVEEIRRGSTLWPYSKSSNSEGQVTSFTHIVTWNDKYLYLGAKRHEEDKIRPTPVPGLGRSDEIKLLYLKPQYFGCWDQAEHWVQCDELETKVDYDVFTYTGVPTSNVTYTSLTTTLKVLGK